MTGKAVKYRPEIDGLRAIAVMTVILFHAGLPYVHGGFLGVDIFFVISGYLITTIILSELEKNRFSILEFYERRARRILPALFSVVFVSLPAAWVLLFPNDMKEFGEGLIGIALFLSNFIFWEQSSYFASAAELRPMLHTWSLAVEEQFYIIFPILMMACWHWRGARAVSLIIIILLLVSLMFAQWAATAKPDMAFYFLPARAWELLFGALLVFLPARERQSYCWYAELFAACGLMLLIACIIVFDDRIPAPGLFFGVPIVGTALVLRYATQGTVTARLLSSRCLVGIGLISYSAYLWHQPLFALARHATTHTLPVQSALMLTSLTFVLAFVTWRFVEQPFRDRSFLTRRHIFGLSLAGLILILGAGLLAERTNGLPERFGNLVSPARWEYVQCHGRARVAEFEKPFDACLGVARNGKPGDIFLLGDSHAAQLTFPLSSIAKTRSVKFGFINTQNHELDFPYAFLRIDAPERDRLFDHVISVSDPGDVLILAFHSGRLNAERDEHLPLNRPVLPTAQAAAFRENLSRHFPQLIERGLKIVLVLDTPLLPDSAVLERCAYFVDQQQEKACTIDLTQAEHTRSLQTEIFRELQAIHPEKVSLFDSYSVLFGEDRNYGPVTSDRTFRMFDRHHLTEQEALRLVPALEGLLP